MSELSALMAQIAAVVAAIQDKPLLLVFLLAIASLAVVTFALKVVHTAIGRKKE